MSTNKTQLTYSYYIICNHFTISVVFLIKYPVTAALERVKDFQKHLKKYIYPKQMVVYLQFVIMHVSCKVNKQKRPKGLYLIAGRSFDLFLSRHHLAADRKVSE